MPSYGEPRKAEGRYTTNTHYDYDLEAVPRPSYPDERPPNWNAQQVRRLHRYHRQEILKELVINGVRGADAMLAMHDKVNQEIARRPDIHPFVEDMLRQAEMAVAYGVLRVIEDTTR